MPHLLHTWPSVSRRIREAPNTLLVFDFDGTLTPIVDHPDSAALAADTKWALASLSQQPRFMVGILSGRGLADVTARVDVTGLIYAGNHGLEINGPGLSFVHPEAQNVMVTQTEVYRRLLANLGDLSGVIVENKGLSLSIHYRMASDSVIDEVEARLKETVEPFVRSGEVKITTGKKVLEVRPDLAWDKGKAIAKLLEVYPQLSLTIFFGDDLTDEDGFAVVQDIGGIAVFVGPARAPTKALHRLDSPQEVAETLGLLAIV